jgi:lipopolysaccharide export system protein LptA
VNDEQVSVEASRITVQIASRDMTATGSARTTLRPGAGNVSPQSAAAATTSAALPALFEQELAATGRANAFEYTASGGQVVYTGNAILLQGQTQVKGDRIALDRTRGDLQVTGSASSTLRLESGGLSTSRSTSLAYVEATRTITYDGSGSPAHLEGPEGDTLQAGRIVVTLASTGRGVNGLDAMTMVKLERNGRIVTGDHLTYAAADERYVMTGGGRTPVKIVENCRETTGSTLTFFKSAARIIVDGNEAARTQFKEDTLVSRHRVSF